MASYRTAEYAVVSGDQVLAHVILARRGKWVAVLRNGKNKFGLPVSPVNITKLGDLKVWIGERFGKGFIYINEGCAKKEDSLGPLPGRVVINPFGKGDMLRPKRGGLPK